MYEKCMTRIWPLAGILISRFEVLTVDTLNISSVPRNFVLEGVQQIQLRAEDRENGHLGAVAP